MITRTSDNGLVQSKSLKYFYKWQHIKKETNIIVYRLLYFIVIKEFPAWKFSDIFNSVASIILENSVTYRSVRSVCQYFASLQCNTTLGVTVPSRVILTMISSNVFSFCRFECPLCIFPSFNKIILQNIVAYSDTSQLCNGNLGR
jgi:hypothetical protein